MRALENTKLSTDECATKNRLLQLLKSDVLFQKAINTHLSKSDEIEITDFENTEALKEKLTLNQLLESMKLIHIVEGSTITS